MQLGSYRTTLCALLLLAASLTAATAQQTRANRSVSAIPANVLLPTMRAEDERRWDNGLALLLANKDAKIRKRAALAAGRIGDERALPALIEALKTESDNDVRQMIAFAIGEIESPDGAAALIEVLDDTRAPAEIRARAVEALGKIGGALLSNAPRDQKEPKPVDERLTRIRTAILDALKFEAGRRSMSDRETILLGLTAVLRARPDGAGPVVVHFLKYSDARIVADALNTMGRLRLKDGSEQVRQLLGSGDAVVRANAARVAGAAEDKQAFDALLARALSDYDVRVRVSAIRALGSLKDMRAAQPLVDRVVMTVIAIGKNRIEASLKSGIPLREKSELMELFTSIGNIEANKGGDFGAYSSSENPKRPSPRGLVMISEFVKPRLIPFFGDAEYHVAAAKVGPSDYMSGWANPFPQLQDKGQYAAELFVNWRYAASIAQGLRTIGALDPDKYGKESSGRKVLAQRALRVMLDDARLPITAVPEVLTAYAASKPPDASQVLQKWLKSKDVITRSTAAELLGEQAPSEANTRALIEALPRALKDKDSNDAALAVLGALAKQKNKEANEAIKTALDSSDHLIRRRAVALLKANGVGDLSNRIGTVKTRNTEADYRRAIARIGKHVTATLVTSKGSFTIEFLPQDAPLTVDNFVQLARKGYFNGITFHRVVANFVIQGGDPRGDGSGGPGYSIRCEINEAPYERAAVGMALSGKDTGGSQWFVTHAPQPHLDGGYTVFGRVIRGMDVVDRIARGDVIRRVIVSEK
jgi:cyclophilin family peptidyl-prolyl cis-trans isomerase/HEAT repeat protein